MRELDRGSNNVLQLENGLGRVSWWGEQAKQNLVMSPQGLHSVSSSDSMSSLAM